ncbi:MAG: choice-of-anchor X domain-containing protein [Candidatus Sericytochromatia bacterium]
MALESKTSVLRRMTLLTALLSVLGACQAGQPAVNKPPVPTAGSPAAEEAPGTAVTPPAIAPTPSVVAPTPLPEATVDSDLAPDDAAAIENLLDSEQILAYLPADLINDGGVILYQTLAVPDGPPGDEGGEPVRTTQTGSDAADAGGPPAASAPPVSWKRLEGERGGRQLVLRRQDATQAGVEKRAQVVVRYPMRGELAYRESPSSEPVRKRYTQMFQRVFVFQLQENRWRLSRLSPIHMESQGGRSGLEIASFRAFATGSETAALTLTDRDRLIAPEEAPVFRPGQSIRVEAEVDSNRRGEFFVFAHLAGRSDRSRQLLVDDGTNGDRLAGDGIYSGTFAVPATEGLRHFALDVIDATTFTPGGLYRSNSLGLTFRVQAP